MMEINYSLLKREKKRESGEYVIKNAFYIRDFNRRNSKPSRMYPGYHKTDYFGTSFLIDHKEFLSESEPKVKTLTRKK